MMKFRCIAALAALAFATPAWAQSWGSIEGQIVLDGAVPETKPIFKAGDKTARDEAVCAVKDMPNDALQFDAETKGVANVVVYLRRAPAEIHPDLKVSKQKEVTFDQKDCRYLPHMMVVRTDQAVVCKSSDAVAHNVHTNSFTNPGLNFLVQPNDQTGMKVELKNTEALPVKVVCDIHGWMQAWWVVVDHPYAAVTDAKGKFKIENLPVGEHSFTVWHETAGYINRTYKVTVKANDTLKLDSVKVPLASFKKD